MLAFFLLPSTFFVVPPVTFLGYQAPEIFRGLEFDGCLADVWSMGVILFIILTGTVFARFTSRTSLFTNWPRPDNMECSPFSGAPPYELPALSDPCFRIILAGKMDIILEQVRQCPTRATIIC